MENKKEIYLDNSATTPLSPAVKEKISQMLDIYGNPSSLHSLGQRAESEIKAAREAILSALGVRAREGEFFFTSSGTEATSLALFGCAHAKERREATRILITDSEHSSVKNTADQLAREGFEIVKIPTREGVLDLEALDNALDKKIFMASFMLVNNETGALYDVKTAFSRIKARYPEAITHCDAVQGFMKVEFSPASLCADLISVSAHKLHAPKGVGGLYVSADMMKKKKIVPFIYGGGQEKGMRSGTENTIGIAAFGASVRDILPRRAQNAEHLESLYLYAYEKLTALGLRVNQPKGARVSHIINVTLPKIQSETMLHFLSSDGIFVSSGSACSSHSKSVSGPLVAFGLSPAEADCSLRISFSEYSTKDDIDALCASLSSALSRLVRIR